MLSKLIKHEFLASYRIYLPIYAAILVLAGFTALTFQADMQLMGAFLLMFCSMVIGGVTIFTLYNLIISLGQRVYGKPGYLLFSIPAKTWEIMFAKALVNIIWIVCTSIVSVVSLGLATYLLLLEFDLLAELSAVIQQYLTLSPTDLAIILFSSLVEVIYQVAFFMFLFAILNLFYKGEKKVLIGIILYFVLSSAVGSITSLVAGSTVLTDLSNLSISDMWLTVAVNAVVAAVLFIVTHYMMDKKLELQ
jgi:hypothetical protein